MRRTIETSLIVGLCAISFGLMAQGLSGEDKTFFDAHLAESLGVKAEVLAEPALSSVFAGKFYKAKFDVGDQTVEAVWARLGETMVTLGCPGADVDLPSYQKALKPDFKIDGDPAAQQFQKALDVLCPIVGGFDTNAKGMTHKGTSWIFARGMFFEDKKGYIVETGADGAVTAIKFALRLPK